MHICFDGKVLAVDKPIFAADNKGYRYGDGLFETMKMVDGRIPLFSRHMQRLFSGLSVLQFAIPGLMTMDKLEQEIISLCEKNKCSSLARVRLSISRGEGGVYEQDNDRLHYLVECWPANPSVNEWNENGLVLGVYPHARKSMDIFAGLKSANYLPYTMAARFAKDQHWNDCLVLNTQERVADATIANVFLVKGHRLYTPAGDQGGVEGVMRKYLVEALAGSGYKIEETTISVEQVLAADEMFLTNAMYGLRWVARMEDKLYSNQLSLKIYREFVQTIWR
ncbi:MAG: aminotransferase class IV [Chitinophagaceae bacterium]|nr:MAG: aminotransferase class IV [Chitinophagaceae bacterium]